MAHPHHLEGEGVEEEEETHPCQEEEEEGAEEENHSRWEEEEEERECLRLVREGDGKETGDLQMRGAGIGGPPLQSVARI